MSDRLSTWRMLAVPVFGCILSLASCPQSQSTAGAAQAPAAEANRKLLDEVSQRLLAVTAGPEGMVWPPAFEIRPDEDKLNAWAGCAEAAGDKAAAKVVVTQGILEKVVQSDPDRLAFILGHELAHVVLRHVLQAAENTPFMEQVFSREQELVADRKGAELALAAGYSFRKGIEAIRRLMEVGGEYSSFEGLSADHPAWKDRLTLLDKEQASLWETMSAFDNGVVFLAVEQYAAAERCFRQVAKEFPACPEAWANLGYALLMQYCDALDPDDLRRFDVGHLVCGGFYRRPESLEAKVRGIDEELWWDAVGALRESLRLKPSQALVESNLGIAYLVRPAGRDMGQAAKYLDEAVAAATDEARLDPLARAAVLINASVADFAGGQTERCAARLTKAQEQGQLGFAGERPGAPSTMKVSGALLYNRSLVMSQSKDKLQQTEGLDALERYLGQGEVASAWWTLGYERYLLLCKEQGRPSKTKEQLAENTRVVLRPLTSVRLDDKETVALAELRADVASRLGPEKVIPMARGTSLVRLRYEQRGVDLIAGERVLALCVQSPAVAVLLRAAGLGTLKETELRVGMGKDQLDALLTDQDYDFRQLTDPEVNYRFYRDLGLAVRVRDGKVEELVVVQIPQRHLPGSG